jgi:hypothetical protein
MNKNDAGRIAAWVVYFGGAVALILNTNIWAALSVIAMIVANDIDSRLLDESKKE